MWIEVDSNIAREFPGLRAYQVSVADVQTNINQPSINLKINELLEATVENIKQQYTLESLKDNITIRAYRDFFWRVGIDPTKIRPASEALIRRILSGKPFPRINTLVDAYNMASVISGIPIAAFDQEKLVGKLIMRRAKAGESFLGIGMKEALRLEGVEVVISDGEKLIAIYPYRDAAESMVADKTRNVLFLICGVPGVDEKTLEKAKEVTLEYVTKLCGGRCLIDL